MTVRLEVERLTVHRGGLVALDAVTLQVAAGSVVGLIGPNGAGKSTCIDSIGGFLPTTSGTVRLDGRDVTRLAPHERARRGLGRTFQSLELFDDLSVRQNLAAGATTPRWRDTLADALRPSRRRDTIVERTLEQVGLCEVADRAPSELSNGERHLVALARAIAAGPTVLLLDEPAAGLDDGERTRLTTVLRDLARQGTAILLVEHDLPLVLDVCDHVHVLDAGRHLLDGAPGAVRADPALVRAYLGGAAEAPPDGGGAP